MDISAHASNAVTVTDRDAVQDLLDAHQTTLTSDYTLTDDDQLSFHGAHGFDVINDDDTSQIRDFLTDLQQYLPSTEVLVIRMTGTGGGRTLPHASQWVVTRTTIHHESLPNPEDYNPPSSTDSS